MLRWQKELFFHACAAGGGGVSGGKRLKRKRINMTHDLEHLDGEAHRRHVHQKEQRHQHRVGRDAVHSCQHVDELGDVLVEELFHVDVVPETLADLVHFAGEPTKLLLMFHLQGGGGGAVVSVGGRASGRNTWVERMSTR